MPSLVIILAFSVQDNGLLVPLGRPLWVAKHLWVVMQAYSLDITCPVDDNMQREVSSAQRVQKGTELRVPGVPVDTID